MPSRARNRINLLSGKGKALEALLNPDVYIMKNDCFGDHNLYDRRVRETRERLLKYADIDIGNSGDLYQFVMTMCRWMTSLRTLFLVLKEYEYAVPTRLPWTTPFNERAVEEAKMSSFGARKLKELDEILKDKTTWLRRYMK